MMSDELNCCGLTPIAMAVILMANGISMFVHELRLNMLAKDLRSTTEALESVRSQRHERMRECTQA